MITIKDTQRKINVNKKKLKQDAQTILDKLGYEDFDLGIWLTTNATMRKYNKKYRNIDKATDILSFPFYPDMHPDQKIEAPTEAEKNVGDIMMSPEYIKDHAHEWKQTFDQRITATLVHGICHLVGYTHVNDEKEDVMKKKEQELLKILK